MKNIPISLIILRLLLGPTMIMLTYHFGDKIRKELIILIFVGLLSDIFDGIIARRQGISSEKLRRMDSQTDLVFWLCVAWCSWILNPEIIKENAIAIIVIFLMEALTYIFSFIKFGKETCTHALLSKLWGITLLIAFVGMIGFGYAGITFSLSVIVGIIGHIDVLLIILILPKWTFDIPSCYHAYLIRNKIPFKKNSLFN